jgi:two-component system OmpR family response regulator
MTRCLVVDHDERTRKSLDALLTQFDMQVAIAIDANEAKRSIDQGEFDVAIVDAQLGGDSNLALCKWIVESSEVSVILLSTQGDAISKVLGLEMGADDYLTKPFEPRELVARIQAIVRRKQRGDDRARTGRIVRFAGWRLDRVLRQLSSPEEVVVSLSNAEFRLLSVFLERPGRLLNRDQLIDLTKAPGVDVNDRSIDLCISRVRRKFAEANGNTQLIRTVRGGGYFFDAEVGS